MIRNRKSYIERSVEVHAALNEELTKQISFQWCVMLRVMNQTL